IGIRGIGKADAVFAKRAKADAAAFRGYEGFDLTVVNANRKFRSTREVDLGILRAEPFAAFEDALADWIHGRMVPGATTPVPPTVSSLMRIVGWPTETGTPWPSLPQVPGASFKSLATISILCKARGPLPTMVAPRTGRPIFPPSTR